jgi:membrane fusion protein
VEQALFRQEAIDARRGEWLGTINIATPLSRWTLTLLGLALATGIVAFLVFGHYTRRERVIGQLVPSAGLLNVVASSSGIVSHVRVHEGQTVHRGDPLLEISSETDSATLGDTRAHVSERLRAQRTRLQSDLHTQHQSSEEQSSQFSDQLRLLDAQRTQIQAQQALQAQQVASDQQLLERVQPLLVKGYVSAFQVQQQKAQLLQDKTQQKTLARQLLDVEQQIGDVRQKQAQLPLDLTKQGNATQRQLSDIDQQLSQNEAQRAIVLRAPRDGVVSALLAKEGQTVASGQSLLSILPQGSTLQAQLLVPSRAVGFVEPGSRVVLRYQAYPYEKFGQQYGRVTEISRSALSASEVAALTGQQAQEPLYRVKVALDRQSVQAYGKPAALKPGMALDADIMMDRRSLIEWAFEPLYGLGRQMFAHGQSHG